ncbi:MAG: ribbon-helix-helix domain-containing protein [Acidimicrobiia bacterium]|nr:ribbon-helix-helix domain-containing protein [Acidimicrobiia bacterium]
MPNNRLYDIAALRTRRRGRPAKGLGPAEVVPVRIDPELRAAVSARAETDGTTTSEIIREALHRFLALRVLGRSRWGEGPRLNARDPPWPRTARPRIM